MEKPRGPTMARTWNSSSIHKLTKRQRIVEEKYPGINTLCYDCYNTVLEHVYVPKEMVVAEVLEKTIVNDDFNEVTNWWCDFCSKWMLRYIPLNQNALNALE